MKKKSMISLGPGAPSLILIFVVLSLSILGMLSLMTARNDLRFSQSSARAAEAAAALRESAEARRAAAAALYQAGGAESVLEAVGSDAAFDGMTYGNGLLSWEESDGSRFLHCAVALEKGLPWKAQKLTASVGGASEMQRFESAVEAIETAMSTRVNALDETLTALRAESADWNAYLAAIDRALSENTLLSVMKREGDLLRWDETDGNYAYACEIRIHPLDSERICDFTGIPALKTVE